MTALKIGFHVGPGGNRDGIGNYFTTLNEAGIPVFLKSVDDYGICGELLQIGSANNVYNTAVYRISTAGQADGKDYDVPDYSLAPDAAAQKHWQITRAKLPPGFDTRVWVEPVNEIDQERADWMGWFAYHLARLANSQGYKVTLFGWSAGEPEPADWELPGMLQYLRYCAANPALAAVSLHEYSFDRSDIEADYPYLVGRFTQLFLAANRHGIGLPTVHITEWGWEKGLIPASVMQAIDHIRWAQSLYEPFPQIVGASIWYLGPGFDGIANQAQKLIAPLTALALEYGPGDSPPPPPPTDPPPAAALKNGSFEDGWLTLPPLPNSLKNQQPNGWTLQIAEPGQPAWDFRNQKENIPLVPDGWPECVHKLASQLPPPQRPGGPDALILDGVVVYKIFSRSDKFAAALSQSFTEAKATRYVLPVNVHYQGPVNADSPDTAQLQIWVNGSKVKTMLVADLPDRQWVYPEFAAPKGVVRVEIRVASIWKMGVDFFFDHIHPIGIVEPPPPPPTPTVNYVVKAHLTPQSLTRAEYDQITDVAFPLKESVVSSADDAARLVAPGKPGSKVITWWPERWADDIILWLKAKGVQLVETRPLPPDPHIVRLDINPTYNQRDARWGDVYMGKDGTEDKYIKNWGCLVASYAMQAKHMGLGTYTPDQMWSKMKAAGATSGPFVQGGALRTTFPDHVKYLGYQTGGTNLYTRIIDSLQRGYSVPVRVDFKPSTPGVWEQHWCLAMGCDPVTSRIQIADPWHGDTVWVDERYGVDGPDILTALFYERQSSPPPPTPTGNALLGLHASADPSILPAEIAEFATLQPGVIKVMSLHDPVAIAQLAAAHPTARWIVRAYISGQEGGKPRAISPTQFVTDTINDVRRTLDVLRGREVVVELHNEPNLRAEGMGGGVWADGKQFNAWFIQVLSAYRVQLPGVKFMFPGLSPGGTIIQDGLTFRVDNQIFATDCTQAIAAADALGIHAYWNSNDAPLPTALAVVDWYLAKFGKDIWITEASNNKGAPAEVMAQDYVAFWREIRKRPRVRGVTYFVASASDPAYGHETWVDKGIAAKVRHFLAR